MNHLLRNVAGILFVASALLGAGTDALAQKKDIPVNCPDANKSPLKAGDIGKDLKVVGLCEVPAGTYKYVDVNIVDGGTLKFADAKIDFWAANIVVESGGTLEAGSESAPIGTAPGAKLTIHLYGADQIKPPVVSGKGVLCLQERCGVPLDTWESNGSKKVAIPGLPEPDYFYQYGPLMYDGAGHDGDENKIGYFGYKVLAVSYNGTLRLFGKKGAKYGAVQANDSGTSWLRLKGTVPVGATKIVVERPVADGTGASWAAGDRIVLTSTDYLPGHSEELEIVDVNKSDNVTITVKDPTKYRHQGEVFPIPADTSRLGLGTTTIETRAAVALLSRSIQIVSEGPEAKPDGFKEMPGNYFGAHMIARQGFKEVKIQGVEFKQMGQGGRIGHYPVHFHHAQTTPANTFVKDSSVNESMTRFIVLHGTNNVTLARNVGWKSIGHGFYIEDGSEVDNKLLSNIGIYARPAIQSTTVNPRLVPGILAADRINFSDNVPFHTDVDHPTVFWIMNAWNDFQYNMAAGAGTCGTCYWLLAGANSGMSRDSPMDTNLTGYAAIQASTRTPPPKPPYDVQVHDNPLERAGLTPLRSFVGNSCSSAMNSFNTVGNVTPCYGSGFENPFIPAVKNPMNLPRPCNQSNPVINKVLPSGPNPVPVDFTPDACANPNNKEADDYYPKVDGGIRMATLCDETRENCRTIPKCAPGAPLASCAVTIIDKFTSSFHMGAETNFGAMWLRGPTWFLVTNSALTDVQNAGLSIVSGGGYTESDVFQGRWALVRKSVFVGSTQDHTLPDASGYASPYGPFNPKGVDINAKQNCSANHCISVADGITIPLSNFASNQRMHSIYDGPTFQDSNAYLNIRKLPFTDCSTTSGGGTCDSKTLAARVLGVPYDASLKCYMPNAAIAWKQPNGFYYPPAFHSTNLYFGVGNVDIRHFVIEPIFEAGTYKTKVDGPDGVRAKYCSWNDGLFNGFTDVDRQTELSDDDGSLTGRVKSVSVNNDSFFTAPVEEPECESDNTAKTSPYDYVTSVIYPKCATNNTCCPAGQTCEEPNKLNWFWAQPCTAPNCYGVPIYRQLLTNAAEPTAFMKMAGQSTYQRSTMTPNNGKFYIDTTVSYETQHTATTPYINAFLTGETYYLFLLFATPETTQTYQIYVGDNFDKDNSEHLWATRARVQGVPFTLDPIATWPTAWTKEYANGVLTVTMKMNTYDDFKANYKAAFEGNCQPRNFCSWSANDALPTGGTCGCNANGIFSKNCGDTNAEGKDICAAWALKDVDCPKGGCYGFGFKMGKMTYGVDKRPKPETYPPGPPWTIPWTNAANGIAQSCTPRTASRLRR
ncbi:MAG: G8 domain-containing protein [Burkholderiales bacterium]